MNHFFVVLLCHSLNNNYSKDDIGDIRQTGKYHYGILIPGINNDYAGVVEELIEPVEHHDVSGPTASARLTFRGNPGKVTHIVLGDSNVDRLGNINILTYEKYEEAVSGLVLVHVPGGMGRFAALAKPITRLLHSLYTDSFEDADVRIQIAVCMGYNDPEAKLKEYFRDCVKVLMEFKHAYASVAAKIEVQLGEILYGKSSLHDVAAQRNFIHYQLNKLVGLITPLRLWAAQLGMGRPEKELKPVNATNIDLRVLRDTLEDDKWHHKREVMTEARNVVFDWCRGVVTGADVCQSTTVYKYLGDHEVYLPQANIIPDEDLFARRDRLFMEHATKPLDETAAAALDRVPLPAMRLEALGRRILKRPVTWPEHDTDGRVPVHLRLNNANLTPRGRGGRAREARGGVGGRGGRGGRGHGAGGRYQDGGQQETNRYHPYARGSRRGW